MTVDELLRTIEQAVRGGGDPDFEMTPPAGEYEISGAAFQPYDKDCKEFYYEFSFVRKGAS